MGSADLYVLTTASDALADLVVDPAGGEIGKSGRIGNLATDGETGRDTHHIRFRDAALDKNDRGIL